MQMLDLIFFSDSATKNTHTKCEELKKKIYLFSWYSINNTVLLIKYTLCYSVVTCMIKDFARLNPQTLFVKRKGKKKTTTTFPKHQNSKIVPKAEMSSG